MNRVLTNMIRFLMDECLPPLIRDNKYFMWPFYMYAYRGRNIRKTMDFKSLIYGMSENEYDDFYKNLNTISRNRATDLSYPCIDFVLNNLDKSARNLLDVGCGNGFFLSKLKNFDLKLHGFDIVDKGVSREYEYTAGRVEQLPFADNQFDIVTCFHTLEHVLNLNRAVAELKRVAVKQVIVVVPCQRFFYYTLDEHINFFPFKETLLFTMKIDQFLCQKIWSDWVYIGYINK